MGPPVTRGTCWPMFLLGTLAALTLKPCLVHGAGGLDIPASATEQSQVRRTNVLSGQGVPAIEATAVEGSPKERTVGELHGSELEDTTTTKRLRHTRRLQLLRQRYWLRKHVAWVCRPGLLALGSLLLGLAAAALGRRYMGVDRRRKGILSTAAGRGFLSIFTRVSSLEFSSRLGIFIAALIAAAVVISLFFALPFPTTASHGVPEGTPAPVPDGPDALASSPAVEPVKTVQPAKVRRALKKNRAIRPSHASPVELEPFWRRSPLRILVDGVWGRDTAETLDGWQLTTNMRNLIGLLVGAAGALWLSRVVHAAVRRRREEEEQPPEEFPVEHPAPLEEFEPYLPPEANEERW